MLLLLRLILHHQMSRDCSHQSLTGFQALLDFCMGGGDNFLRHRHQVSQNFCSDLGQIGTCKCSWTLCISHLPCCTDALGNDSRHTFLFLCHSSYQAQGIGLTTSVLMRTYNNAMMFFQCCIQFSTSKIYQNSLGCRLYRYCKIHKVCMWRSSTLMMCCTLNVSDVFGARPCLDG